MTSKELVLFDKPGPENTGAALRAVRTRAEELGIRRVVLATSTGKTAQQALAAFEGADIEVIGVTLAAGLWDTYQAPEPDIVEAVQARGGRLLTATHTLMGCVESAIRSKFGGVPPVELIAHTYYTFSQGMKVAVEVAMMAADAGLVSVDEEIIAMGGAGRGADTAIVLKPVYSTRFFELKINEIVAMPR
jgi:hypothetical protein